MTDIKRPNYFTSQFLVEGDFNDEQAYHLTFRRRHNRVSHTSGVADGFGVTAVAGTPNPTVQVQAGTAIDKDGNEIVLNDPVTYALATKTPGASVFLSVKYQDVLLDSDKYTPAPEHFTRTTEQPLFQDGIASPPNDGSVILLAVIHLNGSAAIQSIDTSMRGISSARLGPGVVGTTNLADTAVTNAKLAAQAVDTGKLFDGAVTTAKLAGNAVTAGQIADGSVGSSKLASGAVTTVKIATGAVTANEILDGTVGTAELANSAVTTAKIANDAVTNAQILDGTVGTSELANGAVTTVKLAANAVDVTKLADASVTLAKLAAASVDATKVVANSLGVGQLAAISIGSGGTPTFLTGTITALAANTATTIQIVPDITTPSHLMFSLVVTTSGGTAEWKESANFLGTNHSRKVIVNNTSGIAINADWKAVLIPI